MTEFMGIITDHLQKIDGMNPLWISRVANELEQIAKDRPDLVERYETTIAVPCRRDRAHLAPLQQW